MSHDTTVYPHRKFYLPTYLANAPPFLGMPLSKAQSRERLEDLVAKSSKVLFEISGVFPFDFFPDKLIIDEYQVNIINKIFFWSEQIKSIPVKSITDVCVQTGLFFGELCICTNGPGDPVTTIRFLKRHQAIEARGIIQGLREAYMENIDVSAVDNRWELKEKVEMIGKTEECL